MDGITMQPHLAGHAGVCEIILDRPEVLNAIDTAMATRLAQACAELAADGDSRVVVLSAAGDRAFCVGADLKERNRLSDAGLLAQREVFRAAFGGVLALPQPVIAAVHGYALGGGCELALCCDLIVADETAVFGLPETTVGLVPGGGGTQLAQRRLGPGRAADLIFTGRQVTADEAERIGLADRLAPSGRPSRRSGTARRSAWRRRWTWRTRPGGRSPCHRTAGRGSRRSTRSGPRSGRAGEEAAVTDLPPRISVREVGPRDGLQNEDPVPATAKIALIEQLATTGVSRIEAVSFVRAEAIPQMADADEVWAAVTKDPAIRYSALAPNLRGARRALDAGFTEVEAVVSASDTHNRKNVNRSTEQSLDEIAVMIDEAHQRGATLQVVVATAWGSPYEGDVPMDRVVAVAGRAVADGADAISFGDTTGMATPRRVQDLVGSFRFRHPEVPLNLHFHNTRGTGLANVLAALELGVDDFDASVGGLGGCPYAPGASGNIATEELVYMLEDMGVGTGVDLAAMIEAAAAAERIVGRELPSQVLRAGPRTRTIRA
jgi:hydroxymethylglutaryl-CoA lyase